MVGQYGFDRTLYVLAVTVMDKNWDGRISQNNKTGQKCSRFMPTWTNLGRRKIRRLLQGHIRLGRSVPARNQTGKKRRTLKKILRHWLNAKGKRRDEHGREEHEIYRLFSVLMSGKED